MSEENKNVELKQNDLQKINGGYVTVNGIEYKYTIGQAVRGKDTWEYFIRGYDGWNNCDDCPNYKAEIKKLPVDYPQGYRYWKIGDSKVISENDIDELI